MLFRSADNRVWAEAQIAKYPAGRQQSAIIPLLWRAQEQNGGWLPEAAIRHVAEMLGIAHIRAIEVATFYTMFLLEPCGKKAHVQVCGTTPCMLRGAEDLKKVCQNKIHHDPHHLSADGNFSWEEVECLGACVNAPIIQVNDDFYEDLDGPSTERLIDELAAGRVPPKGSVIGRQKSAPEGGPQVLTTVPPRYEWTLEAPPAQIGRAHV